MAVRVKWKSKVSSKLKIVCWNSENVRINLQAEKQISRKDSGSLWKDNKKSCNCITLSQQQTQSIRMQREIWKLSIANSSCHDNSKMRERVWIIHTHKQVNWWMFFVIEGVFSLDKWCWEVQDWFCLIFVIMLFYL